MRRSHSLLLVFAMALTAAGCGRMGALQPPPGQEALATPVSKPPSQPRPLLRPTADPIMRPPRIAPAPPDAPTKPPVKPQRSFFLDPLL